MKASTAITSELSEKFLFRYLREARREGRGGPGNHAVDILPKTEVAPSGLVAKPNPRNDHQQEPKPKIGFSLFEAPQNPVLTRTSVKIDRLVNHKLNLNA